MGNWEGIRIDFGKINGWKFITIILAAVLMMFMWTGYGMQNQLAQQVIALDNYQKDSVTFTRTINELGEEISTQTSIVTVKTKEIQQLLLSNSDLAELNHQIKIKAKTQIKNAKANWYINSESNPYSSLEFDEISVDQPLPDEDFLVDTNGIEYIPLGTMFKSEPNPWYNLTGSILKSGLSIDTMSIVTDDEYNIGYAKRKKLKEYFKAKPLVLEVKHNNPYTTTTALKNIQLDPPPKKWFQTTAAKVGFGFVAGSVGILYLIK